MYVAQEWAGERARHLLVITLGVVLLAACAVPYVGDLTGSARTAFFAIAATVWLVLLVTALFLLRPTVRPCVERSEWVLIGLLLLAPVPLVLAGSTLPFILLGAAAYVVAIRWISQGRPLTAATLALAGLVLGVALAMADVEDDAPGSTIRGFPDSILWALGQVFRFSTVIDISPVTQIGAVLGVIVILVGALFTATLFSAITAWAIGERSRSSDRDDAALERVVRRAVRQALAESSGQPLPDGVDGLSDDLLIPDCAPPCRRVFLDTDRIAGTAPGAVWLDWDEAVRRLIDGLRQSSPDAWEGLVGTGRRPQFIAMVCGPAGQAVWDAETFRDAMDDPVATNGCLVVIRRVDDEWVPRDEIRDGDVVVTSDETLIDDKVLVARVSPQEFRDVAVHTVS